MSQPPIVGYEAIAKAATKATQQSISVRTAKRYARQGYEPRLPVFRYPNGRVDMTPEALALWAAAWLARRPTGAVLPGTPIKRGRAA